MQKATIIYGHYGSGKKEKADEIANQHNHVVHLHIWGQRLQHNRFLFGQVTKATDLIIIDGIKDDYDFEFWFPLIGGKIEVNAKHRYPFTRETPKLLFIIDKKPEFTGASVTRRFDFIECKRPIPVGMLHRGDKFTISTDKPFTTVAKIDVLDKRIGYYENSPRKITSTDGSELICSVDQKVIVSNH